MAVDDKCWCQRKWAQKIVPLFKIQSETLNREHSENGRQLLDCFFTSVSFINVNWEVESKHKKYVLLVPLCCPSGPFPFLLFAGWKTVERPWRLRRTILTSPSFCHRRIWPHRIWMSSRGWRISPTSWRWTPQATLLRCGTRKKWFHTKTSTISR